ncbi:hypothetical protein C7S15_1675 [Burkholderia cepacia]|nr:hypothetical protein [Burkholderia cepacia]
MNAAVAARPGWRAEGRDWVMRAPDARRCGATRNIVDGRLSRPCAARCGAPPLSATANH